MERVKPEQAVLLKLQKISFQACGGRHHFDPTLGGVACPLEVREGNTGCAHAVHFDVKWAMSLLKIRGFIGAKHVVAIEKIFDECQDELTVFDRILGTLEKCRNKKISTEQEQQEIDRLFGASTYDLPRDRQLENVIPWAKEQQKTLSTPIEKIRRMLIVLLKGTLKPNTSKEWTQERADRFLAHLSSSRVIPETDSIAA